MIKHLITLLCVLSIAIFNCDAATNQITKQIALQKVKAIYQDNDEEDFVDFYINEEDPDYWRIFVDEMPMKAWEHSCAVYNVPRKTDKPIPMLQVYSIERTTPPNYQLEPLEVRERFAPSSNIKPKVAFNSFINGKSDAAERTKAIIISGGIDKFANHERYWNDCSFLYQTLVRKFGIQKSNISVLMSDGTDPAEDMRTLDNRYISSPLDLDEDGEPDINYAATKHNIQQVISNIQSNLSADDHLFIYVIDHGGTSAGKSYICLWNGERVYDYELAAMLEPILQKQVTVNVVLGQCYSGGFVDDLTKVGCVVATASKASETSYACKSLLYDEFVYHWTCAINEETVKGVRVNSDVNGDGCVSMEEAFTYAKDHDIWASSDNQQEYYYYKETPQYVSTPFTTGKYLSFDNLIDSNDLYIKDNANDSGVEPNITTEIYWDSPSVWIRNSRDGIEEHENPYYSDNHIAATIYVKVHNRGKSDYNGGKYVHAYWGKASTGLTKATWKGLELYNNSVTGFHLKAAHIDSIPVGESRTVAINWALPDDMLGSSDDNLTDKHHFCILARIMDSHIDDEVIEMPSYFEVLEDKTIAQKNVSIIKNEDINTGVEVFVRNVKATTTNYSLEFIPRTSEDITLFSDANINLELSPAIYNAWNRGGLKLRGLKIAGNSPTNTQNVIVQLTSPENKLDAINLNGKEFEKITMRFKFLQPTNIQKTYKYDLIQRDDEGKIIGGETFVISSPTASTNPLLISATEESEDKILLQANAEDFNSIDWRTAVGEVISNTNSISISLSECQPFYTAIGYDDTGNIAMQTIEIKDIMGIRSVQQESDKSSIRIELKAPAINQSCISISPLQNDANHQCILQPCIVSERNQTFNTSNLPNGLYILSYRVGDKLVDSVKFIKD